MRRTLVAVIVFGLASLGAPASAQTAATDFTTDFPDVPDDHPRKADIEHAASRGWFRGYGDGTFRPNQIITPSEIVIVVSRVFAAASEGEVTRLDAALFMQHGNRALDDPALPIVFAPDFSDWPPSEERRVNEEVAQSVAYGAVRGWFKGYVDGTFRPDEAITAGQVAKVVTRAFPNGFSRAAMTTFLRHANQAMISHQASRAWDRVESSYVATQTAWRDTCTAWTSYRPDDNLAEQAWNAETAAFVDTADAWRAEAAFWETIDDRSRLEREALSTALAAAAAWDAAAEAKPSWDQTEYDGYEAIGEVLDDALAVATADREAEMTAWNASRDAVRASDLAEQARASIVLTEVEQAAAQAWDSAVGAVEEAVRAWNSFAVVEERTRRESCQDWDEAWVAWEDWARAMAEANDALAVGA